MNRRTIILVVYIIYSTFVHAQTINGNLSALANQTLKLEGFNGLKTYPISTATIDVKGNFKLDYHQFFAASSLRSILLLPLATCTLV